MKLRNEILELKEKSNIQSVPQHIPVLNHFQSPQLQNLQTQFQNVQFQNQFQNPQLSPQLQNPQFQNPQFQNPQFGQYPNIQAQGVTPGLGLGVGMGVGMQGQPGVGMGVGMQGGLGGVGMQGGLLGVGMQGGPGVGMGFTLSTPSLEKMNMPLNERVRYVVNIINYLSKNY
jgi:hypothetical protein